LPNQYQLTPTAARDLAAIYDHIARDNLPAAGRMLQRFLDAFRKLADQPGMGHLREDLTDEPFRFWSVGAYLIIYRPDIEPLEILRVVHGSREIARLLEEE
jgi:plasmid stabilization system protein ParE